MEYQKIMCEFCKKCLEYKLNSEVVKVPHENDMLVVKCENFQPKLKFESNTSMCCSFFRDFNEIEADDEQIEDRICRY